MKKESEETKKLIGQARKDLKEGKKLAKQLQKKIKEIEEEAAHVERVRESAKNVLDEMLRKYGSDFMFANFRELKGVYKGYMAICGMPDGQYNPSPVFRTEQQLYDFIELSDKYIEGFKLKQVRYYVLNEL